MVGVTFSLLLFLLMAPALLAQTDDEIIVTAVLVDTEINSLPTSVSVFSDVSLDRKSTRHLEDVLRLAPNVNYASGASRGRFIQIRGVGERSEFREPVNSSVGVIVDGIDLTGVATAATTLDLAQIEILRGPQSTLLGANALAGLINVNSVRPQFDFSSKVSLALEQYNGREASAVINHKINDHSAARLSVLSYQSDGFTRNRFLQRDDTNNIDETSARLRYVYDPNDVLQVDVTMFVADIDNGYDAFSLDNNRNTFSDQPGKDQQQTAAFSAIVNWQFDEDYRIRGLLSSVDSDINYSFDEDWSHSGICENTPCDSDLFGFDWFYSSFDRYQRDNRNTTLDLRLINTERWVMGAYGRDQRVDLRRHYTFADAIFDSSLDTVNSALYSTYKTALNPYINFSAGARLEYRRQHYNDSEGVSNSFSENLWGGQLSFQYHPRENMFFYALVARGYKAGGVNLNTAIEPANRFFNTETMVNYELGGKHSLLDKRLHLQWTLFYQSRSDIQVRQSVVRSNHDGIVGGLCPCNFTEFTDNAASGTNYGLEIEARYEASRYTLYAGLGLLGTRFGKFQSFEHVAADRENAIPFDLGGRNHAHAPGYQVLAGADYRISPEWEISGTVQATAPFFFSNRHDTQSDAYQQFNLELAYSKNEWRFVLYGKNIGNALIKTRGFGSFGNDPRKFYMVEPYNQFAAPSYYRSQSQLPVLMSSDFIIEAIAVISGLGYVILATREHYACWYAAFINTSFSIWLLWDVLLFMSTALNVYYLLMAVLGWWQWHSVNERRSLTIQSWHARRHWLIIGVILVLTISSGSMLVYNTAANFPFLDSLVAWGAVTATWLMVYKVLQTWLYWIVIDSFSVVLYANQGLYFYALLFVLYTIIAVFGFFRWRRSWLTNAS